jgi:cation diffusion facilitator family transporter
MNPAQRSQPSAPMPPADRRRLQKNTALLSVFSNSALTALKLASGLWIGSISVLSEALHSALDLLAAGAAALAVTKSGQPPDEAHRFGHGKFESLAGLFEAALIFAAAGLILFGAIRKLTTGEVSALELPWLGAVVMAISAGVNLLVSRRLFRVARLTDSLALEADGWHLRTDVWTSLGVLLGLGLISLGRARFPEIAHLDPIAALAVGAVILVAASNIARRSYDHLVDRALPAHELALIEALLREHYSEFVNYHSLRTRKAGRERHIDLHLVLPPDQHVEDAHDLCDHLEADLKALLPNPVVLIHVEPDSSPRGKKD